MQAAQRPSTPCAASGWPIAATAPIGRQSSKQLIYRERWGRDREAAAAFDDEAVACSEKRRDEKVVVIAMTRKLIDQDSGL